MESKYVNETCKHLTKYHVNICVAIYYNHFEYTKKLNYFWNFL